MNFWILPVEVFGRGALKWARCFELIERVLGRDQGWLDYYQREVKLAELDEDLLARHKATEPFLVAAAVCYRRSAADRCRRGVWVKMPHSRPSGSANKRPGALDRCERRAAPLSR